MNGQCHQVTVERVGRSSSHRFHVSWDGVTRVVDARQVKETLSLIMAEDSSSSYQVRCVPTACEGELEVHIAGAVVRTFVDTGHGRFRQGLVQGGSVEGDQEIIAPMPGKVVRVLVQPGDEVVARQKVIVIEAMKMENELRTPKAGLVKELRVQEGMSVEVGRALVVIV